MKKKNYLIGFIFKSKYNFFVSMVALLVLIFSVSTVTYAWIEGANKLNISADSTVYEDAGKSVNISADSAYSTNTLNLSSYIEPTKLYLAPAKGEIVDNSVEVQFQDGAGFRAADSNDISNNYIFFELKVNCTSIVTDLAIENSSITIDGNTDNSIKTGFTLLDENRNAIASNILTSEQISNGEKALEGLENGSVYIIQVKIWNDVGSENYSISNKGREVAINLNLIPNKNVTTLYLQDYTNNATTQNLLSSKTVRLLFGDNSITGTRSGGKYTFENVPSAQLDNIKFAAYNSSTATTATWQWDLTGTSVAKESTYNVYGAPANSTGTFEEVTQLYLKDVSTENLLKNDTSVSITNGVDSSAYTMYRGTSTTNFSAYVPATSNGKQITISNGTYTTSGTFTTANPYYYIFGETKSKTNGKTVCVGKWYSTDSQTVHNVTIQDRTRGRAVQNNAPIIYASYADMTEPYKAYYDATESKWLITALDTSDDNIVWKFDAYSAADSATPLYFWQIDERTESSSTYTLITAVESATETSNGTWGEYDTSDIDPAILAGTKVSFYGGVDSNWGSIEGLYIAKSSGTTSSILTASYTGSFGSVTKNGRTFKSGTFTNVDSYNYYLKHQISWTGKQLGESAVGGKFYGLYSDSSGNNYIQEIDPVTAKTTINDVDASTSDMEIQKGTQNIKLNTNVSQAKSLLGGELSVEYHIRYDTNTDYDYISRINVTGDNYQNCETAEFDISAYTAVADKSIEIKTVLTDGTVYYVADTDNMVVVPAKRNVTISNNDNAVVTATYKDKQGVTQTIAEGVTTQVYEGTELTLKVEVPNSKFNLYAFESFAVSDDSAVYTDNPTSYTVPTRDIEIIANLDYNDSPVFYFGGTNIKDSADWTGTKMEFESDTLVAEFVSASSAVDFMIVKNDFANKDNADYSVTYNSPTISKSGDAVISATLTSNLVRMTVVKGSTLKVTYDPASNKITIAGTPPTARTVSVESVEKVTLKAGYDNGTSGTISEGSSAQVYDGTDLTLSAEIINGKFSGYKFDTFTVSNTSGGYDDITSPYTVNGRDVTISAKLTYDNTTEFFIGGKSIESLAEWSGSKQMTADADGENTLTAEFVNSDTSVEFKIVKDSFDYRDDPEYSVTLNAPTVNRSGDITAAELTGEGNSVVVKVSAVTGTTIKVIYDRSTNMITVSGTAPEVTTRTIYLKNTSNWATPYVHYWGSPTLTGTAWPGVKMELVSGNIYKIEIDQSYTSIIFNANSSPQTDDLTIPTDGKNMYDNSAGTWSVYDPNATSTTKTITVGVISYLYEETKSNVSSYQIHYWSGSESGTDVTCTSLGTTTSKSVGSSYWSGSAQTFYMFTAEIPSEATGFKFRIGDRWFGDDGNAATQDTVYVFNFDGDKALYE